MNIKQLYNSRGVDKIITELEATLQISGEDYEEDDYSKLIYNVKKRINVQHQLDLFKSKVDDVALESGVFKQSVSLFLDGMSQLHAKLCAYCQLCRYTVTSEVSMDNINYISFTADSMKVVLETLEREKTIPTADQAIESIKQKIMRIKTTREKRLVVIMLVCYDIGVYEIVASVAEILFLGSVY